MCVWRDGVSLCVSAGGEVAPTKVVHHNLYSDIGKASNYNHR